MDDSWSTSTLQKPPATVKNAALSNRATKSSKPVLGCLGRKMSRFKSTVHILILSSFGARLSFGCITTRNGNWGNYGCCFSEVRYYFRKDGNWNRTCITDDRLNIGKELYDMPWMEVAHTLKAILIFLDCLSAFIGRDVVDPSNHVMPFTCGLAQNSFYRLVGHRN